MEKASSGMFAQVLWGHTGTGSVWLEGIHSFRVIALDCAVFKVWRNTKPVSCHREGSLRREELLPGMVKTNSWRQALEHLHEMENVPRAASASETWRVQVFVKRQLSEPLKQSRPAELQIYAPGQRERLSEFTSHVYSWLALRGPGFFFSAFSGLK